MAINVLGTKCLCCLYRFQVKALCASLLDSNVLVQRNTLEIVLFFFPFYSCLVSHLCSSRGPTAVPRRWGGRWDGSRVFNVLGAEQPLGNGRLHSADERSLFTFVRMAFT